ncbi:hypothetical protein P6U16_03850 [Rhizobium sp. 32-5/1]|uniref:hypothetical protein n=1 Tax=Rhizobium sp. 32-5/1 TaxID=3019602 RepID=UPI00240D6D38|nr:hypothetical protein [Rhizobium sp. 32-5/1]WEZ83897.1 hypothetical protein P6U16_03850 [Rhizobium sp. 32-5/1]
MGDKKKRVYAALFDGAYEGLSDKALFDFVKRRVPKVTSRNIVRASLLALGDSEAKDVNVLQTIYALAIKHRLEPGVHDETAVDAVEGVEEEMVAPPVAVVVKPKRTRKPRVVPSEASSDVSE